jgi:hypothetical protein
VTQRDHPTAAPNWDQIKFDFEAGLLPIRAIARREGISDTSIHKKAKSNGWDASLRKPAAPANPMLPGLQTEVQTDCAGVEQSFERVGKTVHESIDQGDDQFNWGPENVLRQKGGYDDDVWILINIHNVPRLIERLKELVQEVSQ